MFTELMTVSRPSSTRTAPSSVPMMDVRVARRRRRNVRMARIAA
ncbi:hypothetical protein [Pseudokordiimonas caeni]|nr:hypothetical protein [Pseudokordiimonas caeni]